MARRCSLLAAVVIVGALALAGGGPAANVSPCTGAMLTGSFSVIRGSGGAGHISYALTLRNRSPKSCVVSGRVGLRLLGRTGKALPTKVQPAKLGQTSKRVVLRPNGRAKASARFSPDIPGPGESTGGPCEPTAYKMRVNPPPGAGTLVAPIKPPTPVCEQGLIRLSTLVGTSSR